MTTLDATPEKSTRAATNTATDLLLVVDSRRYQIGHLNEFNFQVRNDGFFKRGLNYRGRIARGHNDHVDVTFRTRVAEDGIVHCRFSDVSIETRATLEAFVNRESMASRKSDSLNKLSYDEIARGVTTRDTSDQPKTIETAAEADSAGANSKVRALAAMVLVASIAGIFILVGAFVSARNQVSIMNAAMVGNYLPIQSGTEGLVTQVFFEEGQEVKAGDELFRIQNRQTETQLAFAEADLLEARAEETAIQHQITNYHSKLELVAENLTQRILGARADLLKAKIENNAQFELYNTKQRLFDRGLIPKRELDEALTRSEILRADVDSRKSVVGVLEVDYKATTEHGILSIGDVLEDELTELKAAHMVATANVDRAVAQITAIAHSQDVVQAPTDGRVFAVYRQRGEFVKLADSVLSLSRNDNYWASGSVSSQEADKIRPGQRVRVTAPSLGLDMQGEITAVGHRALYTTGGWSQDFRSAALDVPVKVRLPNMPTEVPSGLRLKMSVDLGFKWPWQKETNDNLIGDVYASTIDTSEANSRLPSVGAGLPSSSVPITGSNAVATGETRAARESWSEHLERRLSSQLPNMADIKISLSDDGGVKIQLGSSVSFSTGSGKLSLQGRQTMKKIGDVLSNHKDVQINIAGHTDNVVFKGDATIANNLKLSAKRANSVKNYLAHTVGIPPYRISAVGLGDRYPLASNLTPTGRSKNRRIEIDLTHRFGKTDKASRDADSSAAVATNG